MSKKKTTKTKLSDTLKPFPLRLPPVLKKRLAKEAETKRTSINSLIILTLEGKFNDAAHNQN